MSFAAVAVFLLVSALFSCAETTFLSLSRLDIAHIEKRRPGLLQFWARNPNRVLAALLLGNNMTNVAMGILAIYIAMDFERAGILDFVWGGWLVPAAIAGLTIVFGEIGPKVLARAKTQELAVWLARPIALFTAVASPAVTALVGATEFLLTHLSRRFRPESEWTAPVIRGLLERTPLSVPLRTLLNNILRFGRLPVSQLMVPRDEMFVVDAALPKQGIVRQVLGSGYSRVPVVRGSPDNVQGLLYAKDLLALGRGEALYVIEDLLRPAASVSPEAPLIDLLREFRKGHHHLALVRDAAGRVLGLIALQDILENVVGDVREKAGA